VLATSADEFKLVDGASSSDGLRAALADIAKGAPSSSAPPNEDSSTAHEKQPEPPKVKPLMKPAAHQWGSVNPATFESECLEHACVIAWADQSNVAHKAVLDALLVSYGREKRFQLVLGTPELRAKFNLEGSSEPAVLVFSAKRRHFAKAEEFSEVAVKRLLDRVIGGDIKYTKIEL